MKNEIKYFKQADIHNYGLDLLRVISMLSIIGLHIVNAGSGYTNSDGYVDNLLWMIFYMIIVSSVNVFAMLSGYLYSSKKAIKNKNIVKLLLNTIFYYLVITGVFYICNRETLSTKDLITGIFPPIFGKNWYIVCYVFMFFSIPYINFFIEKISKRTFEKLIVMLFILLSIIPTFGIYDYFRTGSGYSPWWLIYCYMIGCYIKLYDVPKKIKTKFMIISILIVCLCMIFILANILIFDRPAGFFTTLLKQYTSPNTVFFAIMLITVFKNMKIPNSVKKYIKILSTTSFSVYIIHAHPLVMYKIFNGNFLFLNKYNSFVAIFCVIIICVLIYLICSAIDYVRLIIFKLVRAEKLENYIGQKLDAILNIETQ